MSCKAVQPPSFEVKSQLEFKIERLDTDRKISVQEADSSDITIGATVEAQLAQSQDLMQSNAEDKGDKRSRCHQKQSPSNRLQKKKRTNADGLNRWCRAGKPYKDQSGKDIGKYWHCVFAVCPAKKGWMKAYTNTSSSSRNLHFQSYHPAVWRIEMGTDPPAHVTVKGTWDVPEEVVSYYKENGIEVNERLHLQPSVAVQHNSPTAAQCYDGQADQNSFWGAMSQRVLQSICFQLVQDGQPPSVVNLEGKRQCFQHLFGWWRMPQAAFIRDMYLPAVADVTKARIKDDLWRESLGGAMTTERWRLHDHFWFQDLTIRTVAEQDNTLVPKQQRVDVRHITFTGDPNTFIKYVDSRAREWEVPFAPGIPVFIVYGPGTMDFYRGKQYTLVRCSRSKLQELVRSSLVGVTAVAQAFDKLCQVANYLTHNQMEKWITLEGCNRWDELTPTGNVPPMPVPVPWSWVSLVDAAECYDQIHELLVDGMWMSFYERQVYAKLALTARDREVVNDAVEVLHLVRDAQLKLRRPDAATGAMVMFEINKLYNELTDRERSDINTQEQEELCQLLRNNLSYQWNGPCALVFYAMAFFDVRSKSFLPVWLAENTVKGSGLQAEVMAIITKWMQAVESQHARQGCAAPSKRTTGPSMYYNGPGIFAMEQTELRGAEFTFNVQCSIEEELREYMSSREVYSQDDLGSDGCIDLFKWWGNSKSRYPRLYTLAKIVLAVPATSAATQQFDSQRRSSSLFQGQSMPSSVFNNLSFLHLNATLQDFAATTQCSIQTYQRKIYRKMVKDRKQAVATVPEESQSYTVEDGQESSGQSNCSSKNSETSSCELSGSSQVESESGALDGEGGEEVQGSISQPFTSLFGVFEEESYKVEEEQKQDLPFLDLSDAVRIPVGINYLRDLMWE